MIAHCLRPGVGAWLPPAPFSVDVSRRRARIAFLLARRASSPNTERGGIVRSLFCVVTVAAALLVSVPGAGAQELSGCPREVDAVFWGGAQQSCWARRSRPTSRRARSTT